MKTGGNGPVNTYPSPSRGGARTSRTAPEESSLACRGGWPWLASCESCSSTKVERPERSMSQGLAGSRMASRESGVGCCLSAKRKESSKRGQKRVDSTVEGKLTEEDNGGASIQFTSVEAGAGGGDSTLSATSAHPPGAACSPSRRRIDHQSHSCLQLSEHTRSTHKCSSAPVRRKGEVWMGGRTHGRSRRGRQRVRCVASKCNDANGGAGPVVGRGIVGGRARGSF